MRRYRFIALFILFCASHPASAQEGSRVAGDTPIDISKINFSKNVSDEIEMFYFTKKADLTDIYRDNEKSFRRGIIHKKNIPNECIAKNAAIRFRIYNGADSA